jgi:gallate dioxygenase
MTQSMADRQQALGPTAALGGICLLTTQRAHRAYRLTRFVGALRHAGHRQSFAADPEASMAEAGLSAQERGMVRSKDFAAMLEYGVPTVGIAKIARALDVNLLQMGAAGRNQSVAEFLAQRKQRNEGWPWHF